MNWPLHHRQVSLQIMSPQLVGIRDGSKLPIMEYYSNGDIAQQWIAGSSDTMEMRAESRNRLHWRQLPSVLPPLRTVLHRLSDAMGITVDRYRQIATACTSPLVPYLDNLIDDCVPCDGGVLAMTHSRTRPDHGPRMDMLLWSPRPNDASSGSWLHHRDAAHAITDDDAQRFTGRPAEASHYIGTFIRNEPSFTDSIQGVGPFIRVGYQYKSQWQQVLYRIHDAVLIRVNMMAKVTRSLPPMPIPPPTAPAKSSSSSRPTSRAGPQAQTRSEVEQTEWRFEYVSRDGSQLVVSTIEGPVFICDIPTLMNQPVDHNAKPAAEAAAAAVATSATMARQVV